MRLALKTLTYASMHLTVAVAVAYALTRDWRVALAVGIVEPLVQTVFFNLHERAWSRADRRRDQKRRQDLMSTEPPEPSASVLAPA
ncbi:MAG: hypothetical protein B7Z44_18675 [Caulobacter sp. 12-67-6]|mgnify:CR=1 FL=1|nr:MAG: hypothetical protein B7Z44_18675 [Caulobacter sp. 12-67-6]OYX72015.1 MAG: hypothetical protein B7Y81_07510 [Caulobacter sp. 32-67-35]OYX89095.1 MAG: hypothetical protein B7Y78_14805 [Caulobacter sp. 35-67-4]